MRRGVSGDSHCVHVPDAWAEGSATPEDEDVLTHLSADRRHQAPEQLRARGARIVAHAARHGRCMEEVQLKVLKPPFPSRDPDDAPHVRKGPWMGHVEGVKPDARRGVAAAQRFGVRIHEHPLRMLL